MDSARRLRFLVLWLLVFVPLSAPQEEPTKEEDPPREAKRDPRVVAIDRAMAEQAARPVPVYFKIRIQEDHPAEDEKVQAEGELWSVGDQKLRFRLGVRVSRRGPTTRHELVINEEGAWVRLPIGGVGGVIRFDQELWRKIQYMQKRGKAHFGTGMEHRMDILSNLEDQGFHLVWRGQRKIGELVVDEIHATRKAPGSGRGTLDDPAGRIDRCVLLIGERDRIPRRMEWFAGQESVRLVEYSDISVGKELDPEVFTFIPEEGDKVIPAQRHPFLAYKVQEILAQYEEEVRREKAEEAQEERPPAARDRRED